MSKATIASLLILSVAGSFGLGVWAVDPFGWRNGTPGEDAGQFQYAKTNAESVVPPSSSSSPPPQIQRDAAAGPGAVKSEFIDASGLPPGEVFRDCADCPEIVVVPAGSFLMGSLLREAGRRSDEGPQRSVAIEQDFGIGKYEVTWAEWESCVADGGCTDELVDPGWGKGAQPVLNISWDDAKAYVAWLSRRTGQSYRLLSEAEWEYAARGGTTTAYPWGPTIDANKANCMGGCGEEMKVPGPIGSFEANAFGLHDTQGNLDEWVEDCYADTYLAGQPIDGRAHTPSNCDRRVIRGGSWLTPPERLRSAARMWSVRTYRDVYVGFRVAREL